jgi:hypothetical protein
MVHSGVSLETSEDVAEAVPEDIRTIASSAPKNANATTSALRENDMPDEYLI